MSDTVSKKKRSEIMSKIRSKNTKLETDFRRKVWNKGLRYKLYYKIAGKPDFVFVSKKTAVFIDSCFWHRCLKHFRQPSSNIEYWKPKIEKNLKRDKEINKILKKDNWKVLRFWEHDINKRPDKCVEKIVKTYNAAPSSTPMKRRKIS